MSKHLTMLELKQIECEQAFKDVATIHDLIRQTTPPLAYGTIMNAINQGKLVACKKGGEGKGGTWLIHLPSARNLWRKRFLAKEFKNS